MEVRVNKNIQIELSVDEATHLKTFIGRKNEPVMINGSIFHSENGMFRTMCELHIHLDGELDRLKKGKENG